MNWPSSGRGRWQRWPRRSTSVASQPKTPPQKASVSVRAGSARVPRGDVGSTGLKRTRRRARVVEFADMAKVGRNPARIIPVWRQFVSERAAGGGRIRGIGEPVWAGRGPSELAEAQRHEALLNLAFAGTPGMWLLCPYDV